MDEAKTRLIPDWLLTPILNSVAHMSCRGSVKDTGKTMGGASTLVDERETTVEKMSEVQR